MLLWFLYGVLLPPTLLFLVQLALPRRVAPLVLWRGARALVETRGGRAILAAALAVGLLNSAQCLIDPALSRALGYDLTAFVRNLEGDFVERAQAFLPASLEGFFSWIYLAGYISFLLFPLVVLHELGRVRASGRYVAGFVWNYALALPFYLFVPVREVAWSGLSDARPLMENVWPGISEAMRVGSALDNCFPSLHVSCSTTALWFAVRYGGRAATWTAAVTWTLIVYSVLGLGIHWGLDVAAGIPFGALCAVLGERFGSAAPGGGLAEGEGQVLG